jgi:hypothetical protein
MAQRGGAGGGPGGGPGGGGGGGGGMAMGHGGGGTWGHPSPIRPPFPGRGGYRWWGGPRWSGSGFPGYAVGAAGFSTPICASPLFPLAPSCSFGDSFNAGYYPPPENPSPAPNVIVIAPPPPPPVPTAESVPKQSPPVVPEVSETPRPVSSANDPYPPLIVLKSGGMYSVRRYWTKGRNLYFVTTAGDTLYAPSADLDRIVPGSKGGK